MPADPLILGLDTSGPSCAVALCQGARVLAEAREEMAKGQAERLVPMIQQVLDNAAVPADALDAIAVAIGPGNFTGLRIAVATARGMAMGLGIPAVGVTNFEIAHTLDPQASLIALPAPRESAYVQHFVGGNPEGEAHQMSKLPHAVSLSTVPQGSAQIACQIAAAKLAQGTPPPAAPLYVRAPDASPGKHQAPKIIA